MSLAISWECWNSAQSILMQALASPKSDSATASTTRVLPEPVGPEEQEVADGAPGSVHARQEHLIDFSNFFDRLVLAYDLAAEVDFEVTGVIAAAGWVKHGGKVRSHSLSPLIPFRKLQSFWKIAHFCHLGWTVLLSSPGTVLCTPFANSPKSLSPMFLVDLDASSAILIDLRFGGQIL